MLEILSRCGGPTGIAKAGRRKLTAIAKVHAPRLGDKLVEAIITALGEQTLTVPGTAAADTILPQHADSLKPCCSNANKSLPVLTSMPGVGVRTAARILLKVGDASNFASSARLATYTDHDPAGRAAHASSQAGSVSVDSHAAEFVAVQCAQAGEDLLSVAGQLDPDGPRVVGVRHPSDEVLFLCPVDEFHDAVVAQLKALGQLGHEGPFTAGEAFERKEELVLLWGEVVVAHRLLAEAEVPVDAEAEAGQCLEVLFGQRLWLGLLVRAHGPIAPCLSPHPRRHPNQHLYRDTILTPASTRGCVVLSHAERRELREMQHQLSTEDPEFVRRFDAPERRRTHERRRRQPPRLILAEMVIALGIMDPNPLTDAQIAALMGIPAPRRSRP